MNIFDIWELIQIDSILCIISMFWANMTFENWFDWSHLMHYLNVLSEYDIWELIPFDVFPFDSHHQCDLSSVGHQAGHLLWDLLPISFFSWFVGHHGFFSDCECLRFFADKVSFQGFWPRFAKWCPASNQMATNGNKWADNDQWSSTFQKNSWKIQLKIVNTF